MKKIKNITIIAGILAMALIMAGCGKKSEINKTEDNKAIESEAVVTPEVIPIEEEAEEPADIVEEEPSLDIIPEEYWYSLTVKINPYVELYFDKDNIINGIAYLNEDAIDAFSEEDIIGKSLSEGMRELITIATDKGYGKDDPSIDIELCKLSDDAKDGFDTAILVEASNAISGKNDKEPEEAEVETSTKELTVVMKVSKEIEETTGIVAPSVCPDCNGTGNSCKECNGEGIVNCKRCTGGVETCGTCHGSAVINCHGCGGKGGDCTRCGGTGKMACDACGGRGSFNCSWCKGELRHICPECWGEGSCDTCGGTGIIL